MKHPKDSQQHKVLHHHHRHVLKHGIVLIIILGVFHAIAFGAFYYLEKQELRQNLMDFSEQTTDQSFDNRYLQESPSESYVILKNEKEEDRHEGFSERRIGNHDYYVYQSPNSPYIVAKSEAGVQREVVKVGAILAVLYLVECITFFFWYNNIKELIKEIFSI